MSEGPLSKPLDTFKELVWDTLLKKAITSWLTKVLGATLAGGPLGWLLTAIISSFATHFYTFIKDVLNLNAIAFNNEEAQEEYDRSSVKLMLVYDAEGMDSEAYRKARDENKAHLSNFVQYGPARKSG